MFEFTVVVVVGGLDGLCCDLCPTDFIPPAPTYMPEDSGSPLGIDKASWNYDFAPGDAAAFDDEKGGDGAVKPTKFLEEKGKPPITISGLEQRLNDLESLSSKHLEKELTNAKDLKEESQSYISTSSQSKIARKTTNSKDATTSTISTSFHSHSKQPENKKLWQQVQQIEKESNRRIPMTSFLETQGFVQDILNNIPLMYKSCCNLCGEDKFAKMDYDDNQYPMLPFLNPHPLFLLELSMRQRLNVLNRKTTKMSNSNKMTNRIGRRKGTSGSGSQLLHHGKAKTKQTISTHGFTSTLSSAASSPSTLSSVSGKKKAPPKTSVDEEEADEMAKKTCGCSLCPRSDQSKDGGGTTWKGPFADPATSKDRWMHDAQGTRKDPFNHRTDLPPPRQRIDLQKDNHHKQQNAAMGGLLRL